MKAVELERLLRGYDLTSYVEFRLAHITVSHSRKEGKFPLIITGAVDEKGQPVEPSSDLKYSIFFARNAKNIDDIIKSLGRPNLRRLLPEKVPEAVQGKTVLLVPKDNQYYGYIVD